MPNLEAGAAFGPYRLIRPLGRGGFAEVWEAESLGTGRTVALKILTEFRAESERGLERFRQEGRLAASLSHPRCVYVFDAGAVGDVPFISMELVPGGTLQERLRAGPLEIVAAVDCVLDMVDGLEAAHAAGILHRDIKPSNVFLDEHGRAKIGDFGISKSLESPGSLSLTGAFLGTPQYASPEQAGGEPLDSRSDLYSAGAVLYELLTGRPPFTGDNPSQVLARVLTQPPPPLRRAGAPVPRGLERVVLRLLAKQREKRFQSYQDLRHALAPYSSRGLSTAELARRLGAIAVDLVLYSLVGVFGIMRLTLRSPRVALLIEPLVLIAYFSVTEGLLGGSLGKRLTRLRVTTPAGAAPSLGRVALRSGVFVLLYLGLTLLLGALAPTLAAHAPWLSTVTLLGGIGLVVSTMRPANGFRGPHELVSGTRVVAVQRRDRAAPVPSQSPTGAAPAGATTSFGPYRPRAVVWQAGSAGFLLAWDEALRRDVWIHAFAAAGMAPAPEQLRARGPGSLPWLQRAGREGAWWDAYGAPTGIGFTRWVAQRGRLGWGDMRDVLGSLARELEARLAHEESAGSLSLEHLWIEGTGRALLLDFPTTAPPVEVAAVTPGDWHGFVRAVVRFGLEGQARAQGGGPPQVPLPAYARPLVQRLAGGGPAFASLQELIQALDGVAHRPTQVTRARRLGSLLTASVLPVLLLISSFLIPAFLSGMPRWLRDLSVDRSAYLGALRVAGAVPPGDSGAATARRTAEAVTIVLAADVAEARRQPQLGAQALAAIPLAERAEVDSAARRSPAATRSEVDSARAWLDRHIATPSAIGRTMAQRLGRTVVRAFEQLGGLGMIAVVLALLLRGPLLLHLFGIGVQRRDGAPATRWHCGVRSLLGWSPLITLALVPVGTPVAVRLALGAIALAGAVYAVITPERGPADRIVGTVLVPK